MCSESHNCNLYFNDASQSQAKEANLRYQRSLCFSYSRLGWSTVTHLLPTCVIGFIVVHINVKVNLYVTNVVVAVTISILYEDAIVLSVQLLFIHGTLFVELIKKLCFYFFIFLGNFVVNFWYAIHVFYICVLLYSLLILLFFSVIELPQLLRNCALVIKA